MLTYRGQKYELITESVHWKRNQAQWLHSVEKSLNESVSLSVQRGKAKLISWTELESTLSVLILNLI